MMGEVPATNLTALVAGIRGHPGKEEEYINARLREIRQEVQHGSAAEKSEAVLKLWYLSMLGYDVSWASFAIVETMSLPTLTLKRSGFFACACCFNDDTPVALLTINLLKKCLTQATDVPLTCTALSCLGSMATSDMARDLYTDVLTLLVSSKPFVRRKAVLCLMRIFLKYPPALLSGYARLKELLSDTDGLVATAAVSVIQELARRNPVNYVRLVPILYKRLESPSSNWETIKLIKTLRVLCPSEPRLAPKLQGILTSLLNDEKIARSVEYEIFRLVLECFPPTAPLVRLCIERTKTAYFDSNDMNLKCLGLTLLSSAVETSDVSLQLLSDVFGNALLTQVLAFVSSPDSLLRTAALSIVRRCVNVNNFPSLCQSLLKLSKDADATRSADFLITLLQLGEQDRFSLVHDLQHYVGVLTLAAHQPLTTAARKIVVSQYTALAQDVPTLRPYLLRAMSVFLWRQHADDTTNSVVVKVEKPPPPPDADTTCQYTERLGESGEAKRLEHSGPLPSNAFDTEAAHRSGSHFVCQESDEEKGLYARDVNGCRENGGDTGDQRSTTYGSNFSPCVHEDFFEVTLCFLGHYCREMVEQPLRDTNDVMSLIALVEDIGGTDNITEFRKMLFSGQSRGSAFITFLIPYLVAVASAASLSCMLRCHAAITFIKLLSVLTPDLLQAKDIKVYGATVAVIARNYSLSGSPALRFVGKLLCCLNEALSDGSQDNAFTSSSSLFAQLRGVEWRAGASDACSMAKAEDFEIPFFESLERRVKKEYQKKKHYNKVTHTTVKQNATLEGSDIGGGVKAYSATTWQLLAQDETLTAYIAVVGREPQQQPASLSTLQAPEVSGPILPTVIGGPGYVNVTVNVTVDVRCENVGKEPLLEVELQQLETTKKVMLAKRLVSRSKTVRTFFAVSREMLLYSIAESSAMCRITYSRKDTSDASVAQKQILASFYTPVYHLFQPLPLDEVATTTLIKTQPSSASAKSTVVRHVTDERLSLDSFTEQMTQILEKTAAVANLHIIIRPAETPECIAALFVGREWCPAADLLEGLTEMSLASSSFSRSKMLSNSNFLSCPDTALGVAMVFGFVSCVFSSSSKKPCDAEQPQPEGNRLTLAVTTRTNDFRLSERCATDLCVVMLNLFRHLSASV